MTRTVPLGGSGVPLGHGSRRRGGPVGTPASASEACQERTLGLRYAPAGRARLVLGGERPDDHGVPGRAGGPRVPVPPGPDGPRCRRLLRRGRLLPDSFRRAAALRRPALAARSSRSPRSTASSTARPATRCRAGRNDPSCDASPIGWRELSVEICAGRPVIASFRSPRSAVGHTLVVKGFSTHPSPPGAARRPGPALPSGRDCEGELDEGFWVSYEEYAAGWGGRAHWVDFYGIRRVERGEARPASVN